MTFEDFLKATFKVLQGKSWVTEAYLDPTTHLEEDKKKSPYDNGLTFSTTWNMGGTTGNCWDDFKSVREPDMEEDDPKEFDLILEGMYPQISFMQYKGIVRDVMVRGQTYHGDYYGGSTTEGHKGFKIKKLYDVLVDKGIIPNCN
jgi:hypothetical protein